jgi:hypothetical protein
MAPRVALGRHLSVDIRPSSLTSPKEAPAVAEIQFAASLAGKVDKPESDPGRGAAAAEVWG